MSSERIVEADLLPRSQPRTQMHSGFAVRVCQNALLVCGTFEWMTLVYLALLNALIVIYRRNLPDAAIFFWAHVSIAAAIVALCWANGYRHSSALRFLRHWYPMLLFFFFFEELHHLVHLIRPGWLDRWLIQFDFVLCGVHPTVWLEQFASPVLNDLMQFAYMSYYFYGVILCGFLFYRRELRNFWCVMTATAAAYYLGYTISILFPIEGPYHALAGLQRVQLTGGFFTSLMNFIESWGRVHGAAFPSAHVSGSFVVLLGAWRYRRGLFRIFLPFFVLMVVSTVYGRYHYVADVLAGLLVGAIGWCVADLFASRSACLSSATSVLVPFRLRPKRIAAGRASELL
jgi:membrane-associated phospholipid phosphatase